MRIVRFSKDSFPFYYPAGSHLKEANKFLKLSLPFVLDEIRKSGKTAINLWCRGSSGSIHATLLSTMLPGWNVSIAHVKKDGEDSHNSNPEFIAGGYNIIIDDHLSSGSTVRNVHRKMESYNQDCNMLLLAGIYCGSFNINFNPDVVIIDNNGAKSAENFIETDYFRFNVLKEKRLDPLAEPANENLKQVVKQFDDMNIWWGNNITQKSAEIEPTVTENEPVIEDLSDAIAAQGLAFRARKEFKPVWIIPNGLSKTWTPVKKRFAKELYQPP